MKTNKPKVIMDFYKLSNTLQEQVKLTYPDGFVDNLIQFTNAKNQLITALRFETEEKVYMLRMSAQTAFQIMEDDDDYDDNHRLKKNTQKEYKEKYESLDVFNENSDFAEWE